MNTQSRPNSLSGTKRRLRVLYYYPGVFVPAVSGNQRRGHFIFQYLLNRYAQVCALINADESLDEDKYAIESMRNAGAEVRVYSASSGLSSRVRRRLHRWISLFSGQMPSFASSAFLDSGTVNAFVNVCREFKPDIVVIFHVKYAGLRQHIPSPAACVIDTNDVYKHLHHAYFQRQGPRFFLAPLLLGYQERGILYNAELQALLCCDAVIAISPDDYARFIAGGLPEERVHLISTCVDVQRDAPSVLANNKDIDLLFIASRFAGTERAVRFLLEEVCYHFKSRVSVVIVGPIGGFLAEADIRVPTEVDLRVEGIVPDVIPYYERAKIIVIPVLEGSGTSVKTMEAFAHGACVVTTSTGARIQGAIDGVNCLIRDDARSFAHAIASLLANSDQRVHLGVNAWETAQSMFSSTVAYDALDTLFSSLLSNRA